MGFRTLSAIPGRCWLALFLCATSTYAQFDVVFAEKMLREPWVLHLAVVRALPDALPDGSQRATRGDALAMLQVTLEEYEVQVDRIIDRLALDPQFPLAAAETSVALAMQLDAIRNALDTVYETYGVQQRDDVQKAHAALDELRDLLQRKLPFEREVTNAIGSGFRQQRADLATRWWHGEEPATELRKLVAGLRERADFAGGVRQ